MPVNTGIGSVSAGTIAAMPKKGDNAMAPLSAEELTRYGAGADVEKLSQVLAESGNSFGLDILKGKLGASSTVAANARTGLQQRDLSPGAKDEKQQKVDEVATTRELSSRSSTDVTPNPMDFALLKEGDSAKKEGENRPRRGSAPEISKVALLKTQKPTMPGKDGPDIAKTQSLFAVSKERKRRKSVS